MLLLVKYSTHEIRPQNEIHENLETYIDSIIPGYFLGKYFNVCNYYLPIFESKAKCL